MNYVRIFSGNSEEQVQEEINRFIARGHAEVDQASVTWTPEGITVIVVFEVSRVVFNRLVGDR